MEGQPLDVFPTDQPASTVGMEVPVEKKSRTGLIIGVVAGVLALLVLCGCAVTTFFIVCAIYVSR